MPEAAGDNGAIFRADGLDAKIGASGLATDAELGDLPTIWLVEGWDVDCFRVPWEQFVSRWRLISASATPCEQIGLVIERVQVRGEGRGCELQLQIRVGKKTYQLTKSV